MRIGVTGGRHYNNFTQVHLALCVFDYAPVGGHTLVVGDASGADHLARSVTSEGFYWKQEVFRADWARHGKAAGPIRNQAMIDSRLDVLIAFPGGRGTEDMKNRAKAAGVLVLEVSE